MPEPLSTHRQLELLRDLQQLANARWEAEETIARERHNGTQQAESQRQKSVDTTETTYRQAKESLEKSHTTSSDQCQSHYEQTRDEIQAEYRRVRAEIASHYSSTLNEAKETKKQSAWQSLAVFDAAKNNPREELAALQQNLARQQEELAQLDRDAETILRMRRLWNADLPKSTTLSHDQDDPQIRKQVTLDEATQKLRTKIESARTLVEQLHQHRGTQYLEGGTPFGILLFLWLASTLLAAVLVGFSNWAPWSGLSLGSAAILGIGGWILWRRARSWAADSSAQIGEHLALARSQIDWTAIVARDKSRRDAQRLIETRDAELVVTDAHCTAALQEIEAWKEEKSTTSGQFFPQRLADLRKSFHLESEASEAKHQQDLSTATNQHESDLRVADAQYKESLATLRQTCRDAEQAMREAWFSGFSGLQASLADMQQQCDRLFPNWNTTHYADWPPTTEVTEAIQFGTATLDLAKVKHALSKNLDLRPEVTTLEIPTLVTLRNQPSLLITAEGEGRARAIELLQTMMARFLTAMPPGKVRFTICDAVSLGENFSSFMHLADHDEGLIHGRIWSESRDIDEQLTRLTGHMETILQKYLRNEYESIHEYNAQAGEVAEPFQVLAIANFPHGFSDSAAKRLLSLVTGGPRCGIYVLLSQDKKQRLPNDFDLDDLLAPSVHLDWDPNRRTFLWRYPAFEHLPLSLPSPIENEPMVRLMKQAGKAAKESIKVEVPFSVIAPKPADYWSQECDSELTIPVGRAGANRLQYVRLGKGTSQHLLVAGKTGSGKSTFLHALVTSGAMHYSPEELEFYLVDFKKGVEFKSYATHKLPHARVIAIESEREFGLSVLERLDQELRQRGEKFREAGVQNLADYREQHPGEPVPRVLLVIDEFQELFVEDDKLAQEASLLLDRLVRQGRAFGMHVLLGSQTLSGAYSLARSTLGQMAIRVALQCSEADSQLILSDERNQAARFLSRPGEAIYNDQNGLVAANQPFQVVWLPDRERATHLADINELRKERGLPERKAIIFEGNAPADPRTNKQLMATLLQEAPAAVDHGLPSAKGLAGTAWLGAAVAIRPATTATFARHGGSNLLIVGQQEGAALGILTTAVISLAAATKEEKASFLLLDGTRPGEPGEGIWNKVAGALGDRAEIVEQRNVADAIARIASELARRDTENDEAAPPIYLMIHNAARFRELRKSEDDFSFSMDKEKPPAADKQLAEILKNGPQWGIHTLVWCDGHNAVTRLFDRLALREFEMRVCFQMSAADSSNLLDTPAANKLSPNRALLYNDETGEAEKFRPYEIPTDEWLSEVATALQAHVLKP